MKTFIKLITLVVLLIISNSILAQNFIPFQGIALDGSGKAIGSQKISLRLSILKENANGTVSYSEGQSPITDRNGLFQANIGTGIPITNTFASIDWSSLNYFIKVEMDITGGSNYNTISNTKIGTIPFAILSTKSLNQPTYQKIGNTTDTLSIDESSTICETFDGSWQAFIKLPQPNSQNLQLNKRINTTILINCKSSFSFTILKNNTNLKYNQTLSTGEYALFLFDGTKWLQIGGKSPLYDTSNNTFIGQSALQNLISGNSNTAFGANSLEQNTTGYWNVALGAMTLKNNTIGPNNVALGVNALSENKEGSRNVAVGIGALQSNLGSVNNALGYLALLKNTTSSENNAFGHQALEQNTTGSGNAGFGHNVMQSNITGNLNTAMGYVALKSNLSSNNTSFGAGSLLGNTTGSENTAIGIDAGTTNISGSNNTFLGSRSMGSTTNASNEITLGNSNIRTIRSSVTAITSLSDRRDKKNIQDLALGLNFLQSLKPRSFQWDKREWYKENKSDGSKILNSPTAGFIAQELDESQQKFDAEWLNLVYKSNPDKLEANYGNLIPIIVKAIQDLNEENNKLKREIETLKNK